MGQLTGLFFILQITDVNVDVKSPFIIIPEGGTFTKYVQLVL